MTFRIWQTATDVYAYCWREAGSALRYGAIPFFAIAVLEALLPTDKDALALNQLRSVAELIICAPMMVAWFRMVALGKAAAVQPIFAFGRREGRFLLWQVGIFVTGVFAAVIGGAVIYLIKQLLGDSVIAYLIITVLSLAGFLCFFTVLNRLSLVLVLAATDQPVSLRAAWDMTRGLTWPLLWSLLVVLAPIAIAAVMIGDLVDLKTTTAAAAGSADTGLAAVVTAATSAAFAVATALLTATFFALVYLKIPETRPAEFSSPEPATPLA